MPPTFDESLISRKTPWAALAALERFLAEGGRCRLPDITNWIGIVFTCESNADGEPGPKPALHEAFAWSQLAIQIREAMAREFPQAQTVGIITGAMWVRANMIVRFGNYPGDPICDCDKLIGWALGLPGVKEALKTQEIPPISYVNSDARSVEQILSCLVQAGRIEASGDVGRLIDLIAKAKAVPNATTPFQGEIGDLVDILVGRKGRRSADDPSSMPVQWVEGEL